MLTNIAFSGLKVGDDVAALNYEGGVYSNVRGIVTHVSLYGEITLNDMYTFEYSPADIFILFTED